jgi:hypothetical protein
MMLGVALLVSGLLLAGCTTTPPQEPQAPPPVTEEPPVQEPPVEPPVEPGEGPAQENPLDPLEEPGDMSYDEYTSEAGTARVVKHFDLDSDGKKEQIVLTARSLNGAGSDTESVSYQEYTLTIGDSSVTVKEEEPVTDFEPRFNITDIDSTDRNREVAVSFYGLDVYQGTSFYRYEGKEIIPLGTIQGFFGLYNSFGTTSMGAVTVDGSGIVRTISLSSILMPWLFDDAYRFGEDGKLERIAMDVYPLGMEMTMKDDLVLKKSREDLSDGITLKKGEVVTLQDSDNKEWVSVVNSKGETGWFAVDDYMTIRGTGRTADQFFEGLSNAG